jgi:hypothetical protein
MKPQSKTQIITTLLTVGFRPDPAGHKQFPTTREGHYEGWTQSTPLPMEQWQDILDQRI